MTRKVLLLALFCIPVIAFSQLIPVPDIEPGALPRYLTDYEKEQAQRDNYRPPVMARSNTNPPTDKPNIRAAAQWEEVQALTLAWRSYPGILKQITRAAVEECEVIILTENPGTTQSFLLNSDWGGPVDLTNVSLVQTDLNSVWIRDYGANTVYGNEVDDLFLVDWTYNRPRPFDDVSPQAVADFLNLELYSTTQAPWDLWNCGGNFMQNGNGQGFASNLVLNENQGGTSSWGAPFPNHNVAQIDNIQNQFLGIDEYIKMTVLPFDGINHIDMHMKLLDEETLLVSEYPQGVSDGPQIEANIQFIQDNYTTRYGNPYKIIRVPAPPAANNGNYPPNGWYNTYANGIFVNNTFIVPTYYEQFDTTAIRILQEALPGYNIVGIDVDNSGQNLISAGGAIHCITHTVGVSDPLLITYQKLPDTNETEQAYTLEAYLNHVSGVASATLFWKTDLNAPYQSVPMTNIGGNNWSGAIPAQGLNTTVYYYVEGTANSGKVQTNPLPAPAGYRSFNVISEILGCTDPTACNFNPEAGIDDGSCEPAGCTNPAACNFNPAAGCDDGSCLDDSWYVDADGDGFGDENDENPVCGNPCDGTIIVNISGSAWLDEVSWTLSDASGTEILSGGPYGNTENGGAFTAQVNSSNGPLSFFIETEGQFGDNSPTYLIETGTGFVLASGTRPGGTSTTLTNLNCSFADNNNDCDDNNAEANPNNPDNCPACFEPVVRVLAPASVEGIYTYSPTSGWGPSVGETNITGLAVLVDDGSANGSLGCGTLVNASALNGNIAVAFRGSCQFSAKALNAQQAGATALVIINNQAGLLDMAGGDFAAQINIPVVMITQADGQALLLSINADALTLFIGNDCSDECVGIQGCTNPEACNFNPNAACDDGSCTFLECLGCTNPDACNFDNEATIDNGSCVLPVVYFVDNDSDGFGAPGSGTEFCEAPGTGWVLNDIDCDDNDSASYPNAPGNAQGIDNNCNGNIDPSEELPNICMGDFDGDGLVTTNDLLMLLSDFGCTANCMADLDADGLVGTNDMLMMLSLFGTQCD